MIAFAREFGLKLVATNDVHYVNKSDSHAHDCMICIGTQTLLADTKRMKYEPEQFFLRTPEEMKARFSETCFAGKDHQPGSPSLSGLPGLRQDFPHTEGRRCGLRFDLLGRAHPTVVVIASRSPP